MGVHNLHLHHITYQFRPCRWLQRDCLVDDNCNYVLLQLLHRSVDLASLFRQAPTKRAIFAGPALGPSCQPCCARLHSTAYGASPVCSSDIQKIQRLSDTILRSFPPAKNPTPAGMNWAVLVFGVVAIFSACYYVVAGRKNFNPPLRKDEYS